MFATQKEELEKRREEIEVEYQHKRSTRVSEKTAEDDDDQGLHSYIGIKVSMQFAVERYDQWLKFLR